MWVVVEVVELAQPPPRLVRANPKVSGQCASMHVGDVAPSIGRLLTHNIIARVP